MAFVTVPSFPSSHDGITDIGDFALVAANFNQTVPAGRSAVPEPAGFAILFPLLGSSVRPRPAGAKART